MQNQQNLELPTYITTLWFKGLHDAHLKLDTMGREVANDEESYIRSRLLAERVADTDRYTLSVIHARYDGNHTRENAEKNLGQGRWKRALGQHFSISAIMFNDIKKLIETINLETQGYTVENAETFPGTYSLRDVEKATSAFQWGKQQAVLGPLSFAEKVEPGAQNNLDVFWPTGKLSHVKNLPRDRIKNNYSGWGHTLDELRTAAG